MKKALNINEDINNPNDLLGISYIKAIRKRLTKPTYSTELEDIAVDFITIANFAQIKKTTDNVEEILNVSKPDRFGAKQTIRATRDVVDKIKLFKDFKNPIAKTLLVDTGRKNDKNETIYKPFITALYGKDSFYSYISSFLIFSSNSFSPS